MNDKEKNNCNKASCCEHKCSPCSLIWVLAIIIILTNFFISDFFKPTDDNNFSTEEKVVNIGMSSAKALGGELKKALIEELSAKGPISAVTFCSNEAMPITARINDSLPTGIQVNRVSTLARNRKNQADIIDNDVLNEFAKSTREGGKEYIIHKEANSSFRFYLPLWTDPVCLTCHGNKAKIDPAVLKEITNNYPDDTATGFNEGDLRGAIRVLINKDAIENWRDTEGRVRN